MIENPRAGRVKAVAKLSRRATRQETGLFLLEGPQAVSEAIAYRPELIEELYATPSARERHSDVAEAAQAAGIELEFVTEEVLDAMADTVTPQGFVAVCRQFPTALKQILSDRPALVAILEEVRDPGNLGTIIRAADAAGADGVILTGRTVDLYNPKVVRSTTGSLFHIPIAVGASLDTVVARARSAGLAVLAADIKGEDLLEVRNAGSLDHPTAWVFGNEARGLTDDSLALVDAAVTVPIYGNAESMNLSTAASVCLFESAFAQRTAQSSDD
ncbi:RNA methyltransferase, TrmH family [Paramicrobacterium humi]|uniref:RNA methyltransferase, TrmH family n=1 Tax=Paramicrobacterium humi TaxID=640635 RepID=A0A1H4PU57_9MICO|nr:RNA methyltransferase [Microbacterium humi]SEC10973.1 RNA methyltransferase, TrmH family [Microbacterium humi]